MAANTIPIYTNVGNISWSGLITTANTAKDGTGSNTVVFTAGSNGARIERLRIRAAGTNVATVLRVFINNGSNQEVAANNILYAEATIAATTLSEVAALALTEFPNTTDTTAFPLVLPAGYKITVAIGTTVAAGLYISAVGGNY